MDTNKTVEPQPEPTYKLTFVLQGADGIELFGIEYGVAAGFMQWFNGLGGDAKEIVAQDKLIVLSRSKVAYLTLEKEVAVA